MKVWLEQLRAKRLAAVCMVLLCGMGGLTAGPSQHIDYTLSFNDDRGTESSAVSAGIEYGIDFSDYTRALTGFRVNEYSKDIFFNSIFTPLKLKTDICKYDFALSTTWHYIDYSTYTREHDILFEPYFCFSGRRNFSLQSSIGMGAKFSRIHGIDHWLKDLYLTTKTQLNWNFNSTAKIYFALANHNTYRYLLMPSPIWTLGTVLPLFESIDLGLQYEAFTCDMFITKFYLEGQTFSTFVRIKI